MTAAITGIATADDIVASVRRTGANTVNDQLTELAVKFKEAAQLIDPTIEGAWCGYDVDDGNKLYALFLERPGNRMIRPAKASASEGRAHD